MKYIIYLFVFAILLHSCKDEKQKEIIYAKKAPSPIGSYSQAVKSKGFVFVSGQIALKPDGSLDTSNIENECKQVLENIRAILEAANLKMDNINKASIFLTDMKHFTKVNAVYKTYFENNFPARETIQVGALPKGARIEISVIAD
jgi:2-iminobutanoate/2-iminopropanoate deaminase